jgi:hypothetical protein
VPWRAFRGDRDQRRLRRYWTNPNIVRDHSYTYSDTNADSKPHAHSDAVTYSHANTIAYTGAFEHYCCGDAESLV